MEQADLETAIRLLSDAAESGEWLRELPAASKPPSISEALQMQEALVARLDGTVSGWKVATDASSGASMWGAIFAADCFDLSARIDGRMYAPLGVEGEIAFRFDRDLPSRTEPYSRSEIEAVVTAFPAIEIVSSRFISPTQDTPVLDRLVDRMSNGGFGDRNAPSGLARYRSLHFAGDAELRRRDYSRQDRRTCTRRSSAPGPGFHPRGPGTPKPSRPGMSSRPAPSPAWSSQSRASISPWSSKISAASSVTFNETAEHR